MEVQIIWIVYLLSLSAVEVIVTAIVLYPIMHNYVKICLVSMILCIVLSQLRWMEYIITMSIRWMCTVRMLRVCVSGGGCRMSRCEASNVFFIGLMWFFEVLDEGETHDAVVFLTNRLSIKPYTCVNEAWMLWAWIIVLLLLFCKCNDSLLTGGLMCIKHKDKDSSNSL